MIWWWFLARPSDGTANLIPTANYALFRQAADFGRPVRDLLTGGKFDQKPIAR